MKTNKKKKKKKKTKERKERENKKKKTLGTLSSTHPICQTAVTERKEGWNQGNQLPALPGPKILSVCVCSV